MVPRPTLEVGSARILHTVSFYARRNCGTSKAALENCRRSSLHGSPSAGTGACPMRRCVSDLYRFGVSRCRSIGLITARVPPSSHTRLSLVCFPCVGKKASTPARELMPRGGGKRDMVSPPHARRARGGAGRQRDHLGRRGGGPSEGVCDARVLSSSQFFEEFADPAALGQSLPPTRSGHWSNATLESPGASATYEEQQPLRQATRRSVPPALEVSIAH